MLHKGHLTVSFTEKNWWELAEQWLKEMELDHEFKVVGEFPEGMFDWNAHIPKFACTKVTPEGRCGIYENRPQLCRTYRAGSDPLCCLFFAPKGQPDVISKEEYAKLEAIPEEVRRAETVYEPLPDMCQGLEGLPPQPSGCGEDAYARAV